MEIIINGKQAYLKKNTSFDFIFENRLFTGSDSYTLTITFPLERFCCYKIIALGRISQIHFTERMLSSQRWCLTATYVMVHL